MHLAKVYNLLTNETWKLVWWLTLVLKILVSFLIPFFTDETYYWVWSKNIQLSYFDHPPMVAWLFYIGQFLDPLGTAPRLPFVLISHLTIWMWCQSLSDHLNRLSKLAFLLILVFHPLIGLGGLVANPDIPFLFFWTLSIIAFQWAIDHPQSKRFAFLLGLFLGLAFCSKYLIALIVPVIFIYLLISKKWKLVSAQNMLITVVSGFLFSLPVLVWNYQNDWASISFQMSHGLGKSQWNPKWTFDFILGSSILLFPPFLFLYIKNRVWKSISIHNVAFITLFIFFIYTTFKGDTELNWPVMIYPSFFLLICLYVQHNSKTIYTYLLTFGLLAIFLVGGTVGVWGQDLHGRLVEGRKYIDLYNQTQSYRPLYLSTYQTASYFWFLSKKPIFKLAGSSRLDFYDSLPESHPDIDFFFFLKEQYQKIPPEFLKKYTFSKTKDLKFKFEIYEARRIK